MAASVVSDEREKSESSIIASMIKPRIKVFEVAARVAFAPRLQGPTWSVFGM